MLFVRVQWKRRKTNTGDAHLIRHPLYLPLYAPPRRVGEEERVQPVHHVVPLHPRLGHLEQEGVARGHRRVRVPLLKVAVPDPAARDLARLVVAVHGPHAVAAVPAVVVPAAHPAPGLVHVKHLPVVQAAPVARLGHAKRAAHTAPDCGAGIRHSVRARANVQCKRQMDCLFLLYIGTNVLGRKTAGTSQTRYLGNGQTGTTTVSAQPFRPKASGRQRIAPGYQT